MESIPNIFHDYINDVQDINDDENCRFQDIVVCLWFNEDQWLYIWLKLLEELESRYNGYHNVFIAGFNEIYESLYWFESPAPLRYWLHMPFSGYLIANRLGVIVYCLSHEQSTTCFPLWRGPEEFPSHQSITLAHVNGNHYMLVSLKENDQMPLIILYWNVHINP